MSKIRESIQQHLSAILIGSLSGLFAFLFAVVWTDILLPLAKSLLPSLSNTGLLAIILIQFLALILSFLYIFLSRNKRKYYLFNKRLGIYFHKKTNEPFCPSCLASDIESPLKEEARAWFCQRKTCEKIYSNPDHKSPPSPPQPPKDSWVRGWQK